MSRTQAVAQLTRPENPTCYTWAFPGSPIQVRLALSVVAQLQQHLTSLDASSKQQGVLWGKSVGHGTEIDNFTTTLAAPTISELAASIPPTGLSGPVGYFRVHQDGPLRLNSHDIALAKSVFPHPYQVFLLIQPAGASPATATFFFWDGGQIFGDFPFLEFPFDAALLADAERQTIESAQRKAVVVSQPRDSGPADSLEVSEPERKFLKIVLCSLLLVTASMAGMVVTRTPRRFWPQNSRFPVWSAVHAVPAAPMTLGLHAARQNGDLMVTWNRDSAAVLNATSGVLSIEEGGGTRKIVLDASQVRTGSILYAPATDQIQMQLTVAGAQNTTAESVIVVLPQSGAQPLQILGAREAVFASTGTAARHANQKPAPTDVTIAEESQPGKPAASPVAPEISPIPPAEEAPALNLKTDPPPVSNQPLTQSPAPPQSALTRPEPVAPSRTDIDPIRSATDPHPIPAAVLQQPYDPPVIVRSESPVYPRELKATSLKSKTVEIKVSLDEKGRVVKAEAVPPKTWVPQSMVKAALEAVPFWKFKPARRSAQAVPSEVVLQFVFKPQ